MTHEHDEGCGCGCGHGHGADQPTPAQPGAISFTLNGQPVQVKAAPGATLLEVLRDQLDDTTPKNGCAPQGQCGACTVLIDGKPALSCVQKIERMAGRSVVTLRGVPEGDRALVAECFARSGGLQCGFCIPGIAVRALGLIEKDPSPSREKIARAIRPHLCRCTGYVKIVDAIEMLAAAKRGQALPERETSGRIGARTERYHSRQFALGEFKYVDDMKAEGMLYAALRLSDHPRARVLAIDPAGALAAEGVRAVLTARDVPGERVQGLIYRDWPVLVDVGEETRCVGDVLAVAVAGTQAAARAAAAAIRVDYEVLKPVASPLEGLAPDAPALHPKGNLLSRSRIERGDANGALAASAHVVEGTYTTQRIEHMFLEPESCLVVPHEGEAGRELTVYTQGQGVFDDRRQISSLLGWDPERVYVELVSNGGAFGGKEDLSIQGQTALAAALLGVPVKCTLTREESFRLHPKRHPVTMDVKLGCDDQGRLTALVARIIGDKGAYASVGSKVIERAAGHAAGPYRLPNIDIEALAVYTNNPPCGAMRGFGVNQAAFAVENCLNRLAELVGIDPWEIRWRNALEQGDTFCTGQRLDKPFGLKRTLKAVEKQFKEARWAGIACGIKNVGIGNGMPDLGKATITIEAPGRLRIRTGFTEMGQGLFTLCIQTACEETGLAPELFEVQTDTSAPNDCGQTTASRGTVLAGLAVQDAARGLAAQLKAGRTLEELTGRVFPGRVAFEYTTPLGAPGVQDPKTHITYGFATQVVILDEDGRVARVVAAHDVGRVLNPTMLEGQIEGAVHMGLGYALTEELATEGGHLTTRTVRDLHVLRAPDMPPVEVIFIEEPDPETPYGARGVGEIGLVPTAPAVAAALEAYDGRHRTVLPMKDSPAAQAIMNPNWKPAAKSDEAEQ